MNDLLQRAQAEGTPLIDGSTATFVWQGAQAPLLTSDFTDWENGIPLELQQEEPGLWVHRRELPQDAYLEYAYVLDGQRLDDPLNPHRIWNGVNAYNHYFYMPQASPTLLTRRRRGVACGKVSAHQVEIGPRSKRWVYLYQPPVVQPVPLLVVWDGRDYLRRARLPQMLDNLTAQGRIRPLALAMVDNGGPARMIEYACSDATLLFLLRSVLPLADSHLNLLDARKHPGVHGILGASMGGLMALYTGLRLPHLFGHVLSQSGAFSLHALDTVVFDLLRQAKKPALQVWLDVGRYDFGWLVGSNRRMHTELSRHGCRSTLWEYAGGHNYTAWRNDVWRGLEFLFGNAA